MPGENDQPDSTTARRIGLRMRPDLSVRPQQVGQHRYWVVKDPVALTYFHLREEEHAILQMLDGRISLEEIKRRFEQAFAPLQISLERLHAFLGRLHNCGLLLSESPGQADQLLLRRRRSGRLALSQSLLGVLAIRFSGVDPEPLLRWLYPRCRWLFSRWFLALCVLLVLSAVTVAAVQFDVLQSRLPEFSAFFAAGNVVWLAVALALAKVLHELGHALTCKHFGSECHEMGIMLLVFTPCLYCNVSDAWMLPNKWHRMAISAAGIWVEAVLASICTFLWWFSEPGLLNSLCLNVMFICSLSTIFFNGNPLLRYDGYYVLSDLVEVPNLGQQSRALLTRALVRLALGVDTRADRSLPEQHRGLLAAYGAASVLYRWAVVIGILWFCYKVLKVHHLAIVAQALTAVVVVGLIVVPVWGGVRFLRNPAFRRRVHKGRVSLTCLFVTAIVTAVCLLPFPFRVTAPVVLQPENGYYVYVSVPGTLSTAVSAGDVVRHGDTLAVLSNLEVQRQIEDLTGRRQRQRVHLRNLQLRAVGQPEVAAQIPAAKEALADIEQRLGQRKRDQQQLTLTAPAAGTVLPPPAVKPEPFDDRRLHTWWGSPLEARNRHCYLEAGTLFCLVGDTARLEAVLVVDQSGLKFVKAGQRVKIQLDQLSATILPGTIVEIAASELEVLPRELALGSRLPADLDESGAARPVVPSYQVRVSLDDRQQHLVTGARGRAKILAGSQPLIERLYRYLKRTFTFAL